MTAGVFERHPDPDGCQQHARRRHPGSHFPLHSGEDVPYPLALQYKPLFKAGDLMTHGP
jgi:hypothetical protein